MEIKNENERIDAKLLLVFRMDYIMRILLCPLVLVVNTDDAICTKTYLICKVHW
jgi:hypothetical protein